MPDLRMQFAQEVKCFGGFGRLSPGCDPTAAEKTFLKSDKPGRRIVLAVDDCDLSEQALKWVLDNLACPEADEIYLVHVVAGQRTEEAMSTICSHSSDNIAGSVTGSEEEDVEVVPLPAAALKEAWAEQAHSYLKSRFMVHLDNSGFRYEVELIKEYAQKSPAAIGHCICDAAEGLRADVVVVAHGPARNGKSDECKSTANFVAHYCHRPVVMLSQPCLDSYLARSKSSQDGSAGGWQAQMQWTSSLTRARYPSVTELMGYEASRVLLFGIDHSLKASWAVHWALETMYRPGDEVHLVYVATEPGSEAPKELPDLESSFRDNGVPAHVHSIAADSRVSGATHMRVGDALIRLGKELDARMLFLVNNSQDNLEDFLHNSVTGRCTQQGSCATVVLHPPSERSMYGVEALNAP
eukprot:jgi/Tetstr1/440115/TSEL_028473.t1